MRKQIGVVGVDSGQVLICDPAYIKNDFDNDFGGGFKNGEFPRLNYNDCSEVTVGPERAGQIFYDLGHEGAGVASSTAYGDGVYPVFAHYDDQGTITKLTIEFQ